MAFCPSKHNTNGLGSEDIIVFFPYLHGLFATTPLDAKINTLTGKSTFIFSVSVA